LYNTYIKKFPEVVLAGMFGFKEKAYFQSAAGAENAPKVEF
ncbi:MAG: LemA family protein, partial [Ignavibacteriales bacterium]|nr:LemA family protein [Ignavibacteriales bacterium]